MRIPILILLASLSGFAGFGAQAGEVQPAPAATVMPRVVTPVRMVWSREPLDVVLPVGAERQVAFPASVKVGVPVELTGLLRTQTLNGIVYWLADKAFPKTRVQVFEEASGTMYLLDLSAVADAPASPVEVVNGSQASALGLPVALPPLPGALPMPSARAGTGTVLPAAPAAAAPPPEVDYVALARYAAQQVYGPSRLIEPLPGMSRTAVPKRAFPYLIGGWNVTATPIAGWQHAGGLYVTAVVIENRSTDRVSLDPRRVRGAWLAAAFQHVTLLPAGADGHADRTALYVVSRRPFAEAAQGRE